MSRSDREELARRVDDAEKLLLRGGPPIDVVRQLATKFGVSHKQARRYVQKSYRRIEKQSAIDAPYRREKLYQFGERLLLQLATGDKNGKGKDTKSAVALFGHLAKMTTSMSQFDGDMETLVERLGDLPRNPAEAVLYGQRAMVLALDMIVKNRAIDPVLRVRWITEIGSKLGLTQNATSLGALIAELEARLAAADAAKNSAAQLPGKVDATVEVGEPALEVPDAKALASRPPGEV